MTGSHPALDPQLLAILVCPSCHGQLAAEPDARQATSLRCSTEACGLVYPVRDGIPVMLIDEAVKGTPGEQSQDAGA